MNTPKNDSGDRSAPSWTTYRSRIGDRSGLFGALSTAWHPTKALYPGSYLDLSPSTAIPSVTFVDTDRRAACYFADEALVTAELQGRTRPGAGTDIAFLNADYTKPLPLPPASFDLIISLYAGPSGSTAGSTSHRKGCSWPTPPGYRSGYILGDNL